LAQPINFVYGIHGVLLVETLHLFPMITLNVVDALAKIDPALEEAAESVGARYIAGSANEAAALGVILIVVATLSLVLINRIAGARMGGMFG